MKGKDLMTVVGLMAIVIAIVRIASSKKVCVCAGPYCACGYR